MINVRYLHISDDFYIEVTPDDYHVHRYSDAGKFNAAVPMFLELSDAFLYISRFLEVKQ